MRSKKLLVAIVTLLLISLTGCGSSNTSGTNNPAEVSTPEETSRFSAKEVEISGTYYIDYSCIITDHETGKQYLYTWCHEGYAGGASMVEIGNTDTTDTVDDNTN